MGEELPSSDNNPAELPPANSENGAGVALEEQYSGEAAAQHQPGSELAVPVDLLKAYPQLHPNYNKAEYFRDEPHAIGRAYTTELDHIDSDKLPASESSLGATGAVRPALEGTKAIEMTQPEIELPAGPSASRLAIEAPGDRQHLVLTDQAEREEAQQIFAEQGEEAYANYLRSHVRTTTTASANMIGEAQDSKSASDKSGEEASEHATGEVAELSAESLEAAQAQVRKFVLAHVGKGKDGSPNGEGSSVVRYGELMGDILGKRGVSPEKPAGDSEVGTTILILSFNGDPASAQRLLDDYMRDQQGQNLDPSLGDVGKQAIAIEAAKGEQVSQEDLDEAYELHEEYEKTFDAEMKKFQKAQDEYIKVSARQRGGHLGALAAPKSKFKRFLQGVSKAFHPLDSQKSERIEAERAAARFDYVTAARSISNYRTQFFGERNEKNEKTAILYQLERMDITEAKILKLQIANARSGKAEDEPLNRREGLKNWIAGNWIRSGRVGKILKVGVPAAALGISVSLLAPVAAPAMAIVGREYGQRYAKVVNKHAVSTESEQTRLKEAAADRNDGFRLDKVDLINSNPDELDISQPSEEGTKAEYERNHRRYVRAGQVGALAAGAAGSVREAIHVYDGLTSHGAAHNPVGTPPGPKTPEPPPSTPKPAPVAPKAPVEVPRGGDLPTDTVPWNAAHRAAQEGLIPQGREMDVIRQAETAFNRAHSGVGYHLAPNGRGEQWIVNAHGAAQSRAQQEAFNAFMDDGIRKGLFK